MAIDLSGIASGLVEMGPAMISKKISQWDLQKDVFIHRNVTMPRALTKVTGSGNPRPYRTNDDFNNAAFTDRTLTVRASKWDFELNYEALRNTYLSAASNGAFDPNSVRIHQYIVDQFATQYLAQIYDNTVGAGDYNSSGTTAAAIADGFLTIIADEITATNLSPVTVGAMTTSNAVTKVEILVDALPAWMKQMGFKIYCSYDSFSKYRTHYRSLNGFGFQANAEGRFKLDGYNGYLEPRGWMGSSARLIAVPNVPVGSVDNALHMGTNDEAVEIYPSIHLDLIQIRMKYPVGFQISDLSAIVVNDQA